MRLRANIIIRGIQISVKLGGDSTVEERMECPTFELVVFWHVCIANYISIRIADY
jgi:hypothetical protein